MILSDIIWTMKLTTHTIDIIWYYLDHEVNYSHHWYYLILSDIIWYYLNYEVNYSPIDIIWYYLDHEVNYSHHWYYLILSETPFQLSIRILTSSVRPQDCSQNRVTWRAWQCEHVNCIANRYAFGLTCKMSSDFRIL